MTAAYDERRVFSQVQTTRTAIRQTRAYSVGVASRRTTHQHGTSLCGSGDEVSVMCMPLEPCIVGASPLESWYRELPRGARRLINDKHCYVLTPARRAFLPHSGNAIMSAASILTMRIRREVE